jgi:hypothetical protein
LTFCIYWRIFISMKYVRSFSQEPMTADDRLRFVVRFAVMPLDALRHGDWLNLGEDVAEFLGHMTFPGGDPLPPPGVFDVRPVFAIITDFPEKLELFQAKMRLLQPVVHAILDDVALDLDANGATDYAAAYRRRGPEQSVQIAMISTPSFSSVKGTTENVFHWHLQRLIMDGPIAKVVHCRECGTIFYRVKQQVHCSRACTNRVSQRRFRARQEGLDMLAAVIGPPTSAAGAHLPPPPVPPPPRWPGPERDNDRR